MDLTRRGLLAGIASIPFAAGTASATQITNLNGAKPSYSLEELVYSNTGESFRAPNNQYLLVRFGMAHFQDPESCSNEIKEMKTVADVVNVPIQPVLVHTAPRGGKGQEVLDSFIKPKDSRYIGLTGDERTLRRVAANHRVAYLFDREQQQIYDHNTSIVLLNPQGQLLKKYSDYSYLDIREDIMADMRTSSTYSSYRP